MRSGGCAWAGPTSLMPATPGLPGLARRAREALRPWHHDARCRCPRRPWALRSGDGSGGALGGDALAGARGLLAAARTSPCGVRVPSESGGHACVSRRCPAGDGSGVMGAGSPATSARQRAATFMGSRHPDRTSYRRSHTRSSAASEARLARFVRPASRRSLATRARQRFRAI
jgi:hypothetical protein